MIDAVLSQRLNGWTSGVARFNQQLAARLGVPCLPLGSKCAYPLVSVKPSELVAVLERDGPYDLFLHAWADASAVMAAHASRVFAGNAAIVAQARAEGVKVIEAWCPDLMDGDPSRGEIHVVTLGMAHKLQLAPFQTLKHLLDETQRSYTIGVSTAVHEKASWDGIGDVVAALRGVFGTKVRSLGYLADDALVREFHDASAVVAFFDPAARANNTTLWTACRYGRTVITNLDADSPPELVHGQTVWNLADLNEWPSEAATEREMRYRRRAVLDRYSWSKLVDLIRA